jgi:hypothetical protein
MLHHDRPSGLAPDDTFNLQLSLACPKLGVALDMRPHSAAVPSQQRYVVAVAAGLFAEVDAAGCVSAQVDSVACGGGASPTLPIASSIFACPSTVCQNVNKAAEFFRYAVSGTVVSGEGVGGWVGR